MTDRTDQFIQFLTERGIVRREAVKRFLEKVVMHPGTKIQLRAVFDYCKACENHDIIDLSEDNFRDIPVEDFFNQN